MPGGNYPPLEVIESWPKPNYVDPELRGWTTPILCVVLGALSIVVFCARLYSRIFITQNAGIDDWTMCAAMPFVLALAVGCALATQLYGFDRHVWDNPFPVLEQAMQITWANCLIYIVGTGLVKLSILFFYLRLTAGIVGRWFRYTVYVTMASVVAYMVAFLIVPFAGVRPFSAIWLSLNPVWRLENDYAMINQGVDILSASIISVVHDFVLAALPTVMFGRMTIPFRQKIALGGIFLLTFFLCVAGIMRIVYIYKIFWETYDVTWVSNPLWGWCAVEALAGTICASLPMIKVFVRSWFGGSQFAPSYMSRSRMSKPNAGGTLPAGIWDDDYDERQAHSASLSMEKPWLADPSPMGTTNTPSIAESHELTVTSVSSFHMRDLDRPSTRNASISSGPGPTIETADVLQFYPPQPLAHQPQAHRTQAFPTPTYHSPPHQQQETYPLYNHSGGAGDFFHAR